MKKDRLYKVNKGNKAGLARNLFWDGSQMSMLTDTLTNTGNTAGPQGVNLSLLGLPGNQAFEHSFSEKTLPLDWYNSKPANVADYLTNQMPDPSKVDLTKIKLSTPKGASGGSGLFGKIGNFMNKEGAASAVGAASSMLGQVLSGGYKSGAGSAIGAVGNIVSALPLPGPWKALGPALNIAGGLVSGLTGEKVDEEKLAQNNAGTSYYNNFSSNAGSFDDVSGPSTQLAVQDAYSGGIFNKSAKKKNALARKDRAKAFEHAFGEVENNVDNLVSEQINDLLAQSYAMGGDMDSRNIFALGGDMQTNGSDFTTGLSYIKEGGTHEENPYEGVQMGVDPEGTPNLVEEGERIYNDYVYSNRIYADGGTLEKFHLSKKKKITFSDLAGLLEKEAAERPNDPISRASLSIQLDRLADEQERQKQENERRSAEEAFAALSPEEQQAAMQEIAQQEQMAQQQAMEEQMAMQQQAVPEEVISPEDAYQQEMLAQQMAGAPTMSAYGGYVNKFLNGGYKQALAWLRENHPNIPNIENVAKIFAKRVGNRYIKYHGGANSAIKGYKKDSKGRQVPVYDESKRYIDYGQAWSDMSPTLRARVPHHVKEWIAAGLSPDEAYSLFVKDDEKKTSWGKSLYEEIHSKKSSTSSSNTSKGEPLFDWNNLQQTPSYIPSNGSVTVPLRTNEQASSYSKKSTSAPKQNTSSTTMRGNTSTSGGISPMKRARRNRDFALQEARDNSSPTVPTVATPTYTGLTGNTGYAMPQGDVAMNPYIAQVASPAVAAQPQAVAPQTAAQGTPQAPAQAAPAPEPPKSLKENIFNALGIYTEEGMNKWLSENGLKPIEDWDKALENEPFMTAFRNDIGMDNPLYHALGMKYDFGQYVPSKGAGVTFPSITQGNWENQTYEGWKDSKDPGWLEAVENWKKELGDNWAATVAGYNRDQIADALRKTKAFQRGTQWLQEDENNRLRYLTELYTNNETPEKAKRYAEKFVTRDANGNIVWKQGAAKDYNTIFNNPSGRAANPGTYWHTPEEALREKKINNYVWGDDGWELMATAVPENWKRINSYSWSGKEDNTDYTNNYYRNPAAVDENGKPIKGNGAADGEGEGEEEGYWEATPNYDKAANLRYLGLAGPALALGLQALGVGKPDPSGLDASLAMATNPAVLAKPHLIGDYMRYKPIDRLFYANQLQANSRATDRGIMNTSGGNRGTAMAGLLGNGLNAQTALANMDMQAENTNWGRYGQTKDFNRGTNIFNAQALNQNSMFNAEQLNRNKQFGAQMSANIAAQKMAADAGWNASKYKNFGEFFNGLSLLGSEAKQRNWLAELAADGVFGTLSPRTNTGKSQGLLTFEWKPGKKPGTSTSADEVNNKKRRV